MLTENKPCPPIIRFVSYRNGTLRLLIAGKYPGCQSTHLRNICIAQFVSFLCEPFIKSKFITVRHVGFVCTRDDDFVEVVESLGGVVRQLVDKQENVPMMEYKKLMLDGHPDIDCYIKGLISRDRNAPMVEDNMAYYTWDEIITKYNASYFVDDHLKMMDKYNGDILDSSDMDIIRIEAPVYCKLVIDEPCPQLITTNPLFFDARMYKVVEFAPMVYPYYPWMG